MRSFGRLFCACTLILAVFVVVTPARGHRVSLTAHGAKHRWPKSTIRVDVDGVPLGARGKKAARRALASWNAVDHTALLLVEHVATTDPWRPVNAAPDVVIVVVDAGAWTHGATIIAHTDVDADTSRGTVSGARIELRADVAFSVSKDKGASDVGVVVGGRAQRARATDEERASFDLESLILHELGHALGLAHAHDRRAIMRAGQAPGDIRRALGDDDKNGARALFPIH